MTQFRRDRRALLLVTGWLCLSVWAERVDSTPAPRSEAPNILLVVADDMGFSDPGCYGGEIATPTLDALAANGLRYSQFYNTARCWPTRAVLLTGYYAQQVRRDRVPGVKSGGGGRRPAWAPLLPERLRPLGYRSYHSGKWHLDGPRLGGGFDRSYSMEDHDRLFSPHRHLEDDQTLPPVEPGTDHYTTSAIAEHAIRCLKDHAAETPERPFFHYLCFTVPHFPLQAPEDDINRYRNRYDQGWNRISQARWQQLTAMGVIRHALPAMEPDIGPPYHFPDALKQLGPSEINRPLPWTQLTSAQQKFQATKMAIHAAMVDRMDREIGRVVAQLRVMNALDNTLILFLSDNGASAEIMVRGDGHDPAAPSGSAASYLCLGPGWSSAANTPFRRHKTWVHEGGIATPLIAHWPEGFPAKGEWRHHPGHVIDIAPTILEAAGGVWPEQWASRSTPPIPGQSLLPSFNRDGAVSHPSLWWLHEGNRAIRVGDWKLVAAGEEEPWELYDLSVDRGETVNLIEQRADKARELATLWSEQWQAIQTLAKADQ